MARQGFSAVSWERRKWTPIVGMRIWYRRDVALPSGVNSARFATILLVGDDGILRVKHSHNERVTHLSPQTWQTSWEPCEPIVAPQTAPKAMSEDVVRRIVREELKAIFG